MPANNHLLAFDRVESSVPIGRPGLDSINILLQVAAWMSGGNATGKIDQCIVGNQCAGVLFHSDWKVWHVNDEQDSARDAQGWRVNMIHRGHYCSSCHVAFEPINTGWALDQKKPVFFIRFWCSTRSKAFARTKKATWTEAPFSLAASQSSRTESSCHTVERPGRKPNWLSGKTQYARQNDRTWSLTRVSNTLDTEHRSAIGR